MAASSSWNSYCGLYSSIDYDTATTSCRPLCYLQGSSNGPSFFFAILFKCAYAIGAIDPATSFLTNSSNLEHVDVILASIRGASTTWEKSVDLWTLFIQPPSPTSVMATTGGRLTDCFFDQCLLMAALMSLNTSLLWQTNVALLCWFIALSYIALSALLGLLLYLWPSRGLGSVIPPNAVPGCATATETY